MAQRTVVTMTDDLDGSTASRTVKFGLDGVDYAVDLNDAHADDLLSVLKRYSTVARRTSPMGRPRVVRGDSFRQDPKVIKAWLREHGYEVKDRGRISEKLIQAWREGKAADARTAAEGVAQSIRERYPDVSFAPSAAAPQEAPQETVNEPETPVQEAQVVDIKAPRKRARKAAVKPAEAVFSDGTTGATVEVAEKPAPRARRVRRGSLATN